MDLKVILANIIAILQGIVIGQVPKVVTVVGEFLQSAEDRLAALAQVYVEDKDMEFIKQSLAEETKILHSQLMALGIIGGQMAQDVVDKVVETLQGIIVKNDTPT